MPPSQSKPPAAPPPDCTCTAADPIDILTGQKQETVTDYSSADGNLQVTRNYRVGMPGTLGQPEFAPSWLGITPARGTVDTTSGVLQVTLPNGFIMDFVPNPTTGSYTFASLYPKLLVPTLTANFTLPTSWGVYLTTNPASWTLTLPDGRSLALATSPGTALASVFVSAMTSATGFQTNYGYNLDSASNRWQVSTIAGSDGRTLHVTWADTVISRIDLPDGSALLYNHDAPAGGTTHADRLTSVQRSANGGTIWSQSYVHDSSSLPYAVTGVVDALNNRRNQEVYNPAGQVTVSGKADGTETFHFNYGAPVSQTVVTDVTNGAGKVSHYSFATFDNVQGTHLLGQTDDASTLSPARSLTATIDFAGNIGSQTDFKGNVTLLQKYDAHSRPTQITRASGTAVQQLETGYYNPVFDKWAHEVLLGKTVDYKYDTLGRLLTRTETDTTSTSVPYSTAGQIRTWTYTWSALGKLASVDGPKALDIHGAPDTTTFLYDASNNLQTSTNGLGQATTFSGYDANGRPGQMVEPNGRTTVFTYDPIGRLATRTVRGGVDGDAVTTLTYDLEGQLKSITPPATDTLFFDYSAVGRLITVRDAAGNRIDYKYDLLGDRIEDKTSRGDATIRKTVARTFDDLGRMLSETLGPGRTTSFTYDNNDNPTRVTSGRSYATTLAFDPLDRLASTLDARSGSTSNAYDGQDNLTSHTDRIAVATTYVRDGFGEVIQETSPDRGTMVYRYDAAGDVVQTTDGRGQTVNFTRDALGRILSKNPVGVTGQDITYTYDTDLSHIGRLATMTDASGTTSFAYDGRGNVKTRAIKVGATFTASVGYVYDAADRVTKVTYPSGKAVTYARDARGRVSGVSILAGTVTTPLASGLTYDAFGPLTAMNLGNGLTLTQDWGSDERLYAKTLATGTGTKLWAKTYAYDNDDNITAITDAVTAAENRTYTYDELSRLTKATGLLGSGITREDYAYDANDNRLSLQQRKLVTDVKATYDTVTSTLTPGTNRLASVSGRTARSFTYDGRGSFATEPRGTTTLTYGYDAYGRLTSAANSQYPTRNMTMVYNGLDQRASVTVATSATATPRVFIYDGSNRLIGEYGTSTKTIYAEHVWLTPDPDEAEGWQPLALVGPKTTSWVTGDHLGTPAYLSSATGTVVNAYEATPFGGRWRALVSNPTTALGQPGQIEDDITFRAYNLHRDYDPSLGRYIEADPIGLDGGENVYGYVGGDPVNQIDSVGLFSISRYIPNSLIGKVARERATEFGYDLSRCSNSDIANFLKSVPDNLARNFQKSYDSRPNAGCGLTPAQKKKNKEEKDKEQKILDEAFAKILSQGHSSCVSRR